MKERVCQLFEVFQHEFANLHVSLPCEGRLNFVAYTELNKHKMRLKDVPTILVNLFLHTIATVGEF